MEERASQFAVVIGASAVAESLRRALVRRELPHVGIASHLRGLRRSAVLGAHELFIVCVSLDPVTLRRHGDSLRRMVADRDCFGTSIRFVGLLSHVEPPLVAAEIGFDLYVRNARQGVKAARMLTRLHRVRHATKAHAGKSRLHAAIDFSMWRSKRASSDSAGFDSKKLICDLKGQ